MVEARAPEPWVKAEAVTPALERSQAEVVVVADADVWHPELAAAVSAVEQGAPWAIPHRGVYRLTEFSSRAYMAGARFERLDCEQRPYLGVAGGGYVVAPRQTLLDIPLDPRYVGWGQEDASWGAALQTLAGAPWRGRDGLVHLWHPPQERMTRKYGNPTGKALYRRYLAAKGNPEQMRAIVNEHRSATQPNSVDHPANRVRGDR